MRWNNPDWAVKEKAIYRYNIQLPRVEGGGTKEKKKQRWNIVNVCYEVERWNRCIWQDREEKEKYIRYKKDERDSDYQVRWFLFWIIRYNSTNSFSFFIFKKKHRLSSTTLVETGL